MIIKIKNVVVVVDWERYCEFRYLEDTIKQCTCSQLRQQNQRHIYGQIVYLDHDHHRGDIWLHIQSSLVLG